MAAVAMAPFIFVLLLGKKDSDSVYHNHKLSRALRGVIRHFSVQKVSNFPQGVFKKRQTKTPSGSLILRGKLDYL